MTWHDAEALVNRHATGLFLTAEFVLAILEIAVLMVVGTKKWDAVGITLVSFFVVIGGIFATATVGPYLFPLRWLRHLPTAYNLIFFVSVNATIAAVTIDAWKHRPWRHKEGATP